MPQGAIPPSKGKSNVRIAIFTILAIHVVLLGGLLIQGCKPSQKTEVSKEESTTATPDFGSIEKSAELNQSTLAPTDAAFPATAPVTANTLPIPAPAPIVAVVNPSPVVVPTPVALPVTETAIIQPSGDSKTHMVAKNESFSTIATKYHVSAKAIQDANPGVNPLRLQINQKLVIPAPIAKVNAAAPAAVETVDSATYTVKPGDMLEKIAKNNGTNVKTIKALNGLRTDQIKVGQKLKIPTKAAASVEAAPVSPVPSPTATAALTAPLPTVTR